MRVQTQQSVKPQTPEQRRFGRYRVMLSARLVTTQGISSAVLLDLSSGGAMLSVPEPLAHGMHVVLIRGTFETHGVVIWAEGRRIGIEFDEAVDEQRIERVIAPTPFAAH